MLRHTSCAFLRRHKGLASFAGALAVMAAFWLLGVLVYDTNDDTIMAGLVYSYYGSLQGLLSEAHMEQLLESIEGELNASGALARDAAKWGLYIGSEKTVSRFLRDRLRFLDNYYSGKLPGKS